MSNLSITLHYRPLRIGWCVSCGDMVGLPGIYVGDVDSFDDIVGFLEFASDHDPAAVLRSRPCLPPQRLA